MLFAICKTFALREANISLSFSVWRVVEDDDERDDLYSPTPILIKVQAEAEKTSCGHNISY